MFRFSGTINWFPGHMHKATQLLKERLKSMDIILEVRDARVPMSSAPALLLEDESFRSKRRLILFNKVIPRSPTFSLASLLSAFFLSLYSFLSFLIILSFSHFLSVIISFRFLNYYTFPY